MVATNITSNNVVLRKRRWSRFYVTRNNVCVCVCMYDKWVQKHIGLVSSFHVRVCVCIFLSKKHHNFVVFWRGRKITLITHDFPLLTYVYSYTVRVTKKQRQGKISSRANAIYVQTKPRITNGEELMSLTVYTSSHIILVIYIKWILRRYVPRWWWWPQVAAQSRHKKFRQSKMCVERHNQIAFKSVISFGCGLVSFRFYRQRGKERKNYHRIYCWSIKSVTMCVKSNELSSFLAEINFEPSWDPSFTLQKHPN